MGEERRREGEEGAWGLEEVGRSGGGEEKGGIYGKRGGVGGLCKPLFVTTPA